MRKLILSILFLFLVSSPVIAAVTNTYNSDFLTVTWNLAGAVMPSPFGTSDIPGSDLVSTLIYNRQTINSAASLRGVMKGLDPKTTYTVYISKEYMPYHAASISGAWQWTVLGTYTHDMDVFEQAEDGTFMGIGGYPAGSFPYDGAGQTQEAITGGSIKGDNITFTTTFLGPYDMGYSASVSGIINPDGSITGTGPWEWSAKPGSVTPASGSSEWPGLLPGTEPFTFTTDSKGAASFNYYFNGGPFGSAMSVWVNSGPRTVLISDPILIK